MDGHLNVGRFRRRAILVPLAAILILTAPALATNGKGGGSGGTKGNKRDTATPTVTITAPQPSTTVSNTIEVDGVASDNVGVVSVSIAIDAGPFTVTNGTSTWNQRVDTTALADGSHSIAARAQDRSGNIGAAQITIVVQNDRTPPPDTTAPRVAIDAPVDGARVTGSVTASGTASDDGGVASVGARIDEQPWTSANGIASWSVQLDTSRLSEGTHILTVRASDHAGNIGTSSVSITVPSVAPPVASPTHLVTPEGVTIDVNSAGDWTAQEIYDLLRQSAYQLDLIGPTVTITVQDSYASQTIASASSSNGTYTSFDAHIYLKGVSSTFALQPEAQMAHEYGHAWTLYHLYMDHDADWSSYLDARWANFDGSVRLSGDARLGSSYSWDRAEIIADDYRLLFGSNLAVSERPIHLNTSIPPPAAVPGLREFFVSSWGAHR